MNISSFDLRLLVVFDTLMAERSVSRAADRLKMSQPAVSNALQRLRVLLGDSLFLRTARGVEPTPKAVELAAPIHEAMKLIQDALLASSERCQDPNPTFKVSFSEPIVVHLLPRLLREFSVMGKRVNLQVFNKLNTELERQLDVGEIDIAVGSIPIVLKRADRMSLFQDHHVCVMRRDHPLASLDAATFNNVEQLAVRPDSNTFRGLDKELVSVGGKRKIALSISQYHAVQPILLNSDLITCIPGSIAATFDQTLLRVERLPFDLPGFLIEMVWNSLRSGDVNLQWIRDCVVKVSSEQLDR